MLGHPTKSCYIFKHILQALIDTEALKLRPEQKKVTANMTSFLQFGNQPPTLAGVVPIPKGELRMINTDPHHQQEKGLVPIPTPQGEIMWVHPDLVDGQQWTIVTNRSLKVKQKLHPAIWCALLHVKQKPMFPHQLIRRRKQSSLPLNKLLVAESHSGQSYLKKYDEMVASPPKPTAEPTKPSAKPPMEKKKEL